MRLMRVKQHYLNLIKNGQKTLEIRVGYPSIRTIQHGECIKLASRTETIVVRVKDIRKYLTLDSMLNKEDTNLIAPGLTKAQVSRLLKEIYPRHLEKLGVFVLEIQAESKN
ncbi:MAG: ASCH domain-containing protein [Candidatus Bathyarchaeota archaeon]|nr:ASCH domain-containing protein [Candidatus Bathyarchaeota archaeon]MDH5746558.1 ASCH domain-containing protein [Candidatus Bathyarchaeota archaeon]